MIDLRKVKMISKDDCQRFSKLDRFNMVENYCSKNCQICEANIEQVQDHMHAAVHKDVITLKEYITCVCKICAFSLTEGKHYPPWHANEKIEKGFGGVVKI